MVSGWPIEPKLMNPRFTSTLGSLLLIILHRSSVEGSIKAQYTQNCLSSRVAVPTLALLGQAVSSRNIFALQRIDHNFKNKNGGDIYIYS